MIKNVIFDLGNVILKLDFDKPIKEFTQDEKEIELLKKAIFSDEWIKLDEGIIEKEEAVEIMASKLPENLKDTCKRIMEKCLLNIITLNEEIVELIKELKNNGYKTYILSNAPLEIRSFLETNKLLDLFDGEIISAEEKLLKPNPKIYELLLNRFDLNANECLFLDDKAENISGAEGVGIHGFIFDYNKFNNLLEELKKYNIKINLK